MTWHVEMVESWIWDWNLYWYFQYFLSFDVLVGWTEVLVIGLRLEKVHVPETGLHGGATTLRCDFHLESDHLHSLNWYKDEINFFSYRPQSTPPMQYFPIHGFEIQVSLLLVIQPYIIFIKGKRDIGNLQENPTLLFYVLQKNATLNEITIKNLTLNATGYIKCEISAEKPSYRTLYGGGNLTVVGKNIFPSVNTPSVNVCM